jgi:hypothetical protein
MTGTQPPARPPRDPGQAGPVTGAQRRSLAGLLESLVQPAGTPARNPAHRDRTEPARSNTS